MAKLKWLTESKNKVNKRSGKLKPLDWIGENFFLKNTQVHCCCDSDEGYGWTIMEKQVELRNGWKHTRLRSSSTI